MCVYMHIYSFQDPPIRNTQILLYKFKNRPKIGFQSVPRDTEESEFFDSMVFEHVAFSAEFVIFQISLTAPWC